MSNDKTTVILDVKARKNAQMPRLVSGELDVSLKSNYYDAITDATGLSVSGRISTPMCLPAWDLKKVEPASSTAQNNSVTFKMTGPAMLRGMSSIQILVDGESITKDPFRFSADPHAYLFGERRICTCFNLGSDTLPKNLNQTTM